MSSLATCIKKLGKALSATDAAAIREIRDELTSGGMSAAEANTKAIDEYLETLAGERTDLLGQIEDAGGIVEPVTSSKFATENAGAKVNLRTDNPGGDWLVGERAHAKETGNLGSLTGYLKDHKPVMIDPKKLRDIPGARGEHLSGTTNTRGAGKKAEGIRDSLRRGEKIREAIFITVDYQGNPLISEGNNRLAVAIEEGLDVVPVEIRWFAGGEQVADGMLSPANLEKLIVEEGQGDLLGDDTATAQEIADRTAEKDAARNTGQESVETGDQGDMFSESRKQRPLRFAIDNDFEEQLIDKNPDNPIAQMSKLGAVVERINEEAADVSALVRLWDSIKDMSRTAFLNALPQTKLPETIRNNMQGIPSYVRTMKKMDAFINQHLEDLSETGNAWRDMIRKNQRAATLLGQLMHQSTLSRTDPSIAFEMPASFVKMSAKQKRIWVKRRRDHVILKEAWDTLGKISPKALDEEGKETGLSEAQEIYNKVREDYKTMGVETLKEIVNRINATEADEMMKANLIAVLRKKFESGRIDPYFHLGRFGKYWGTAKDEDGNVIAFIKRENPTERNKWVAEMQKAGYAAYESEEGASDHDNTNRMDPNFVAKIAEMTKGMTDEEGKSISDNIWQLYLRSLPEVSAQTVFIHRVGRLGFTGDALRAYGYRMFHGTHQLGKLKFGHQLQTHLDNIKQESQELTRRPSRIKSQLKKEGSQATHESLLNFPQYKKLFNSYKGTEQERIDKTLAKYLKQAEVDAPWATPLAKEMDQRHNYNMNPESSLWSTQLTKLGFFWFLSTSPAAGVLNLSQTAIVALPTIAARFAGDFGAAALPMTAGHLLQASYQLARTRGSLANSLKGDELKAFKQFELDGGTSKTRVRDLTGYAERGENFTGRGQRLEDIATWIFHRTEKWNREVSFLASYRMSMEARAKRGDKKTTDSVDSARMESDNLVEKSHYDYTNTNRPRFMQKDEARVVFLFRNYSLNMTYRLARDFRDGYMRNQSVDIKVRNEAALRLTGILGGTFMFAGLAGMPLAYAFHSILDVMLGDDDDPYDSQAAFRAHLTELYGENIATFITKGAWDTLTQTTLSTRASLNNLWIREIPDQLSGKELFQHMLVEAAGPLAGIAMNAAEGVSTWNEGYSQRGLEKLVPKFAADAMKAIRYATEGALNYDRDVIMGPEEFSAWNLGTQFFGTTPTPLTTRYEQQRAIKDYQSALERRKKYLMDRLFMARKMGDRREVSNTRKLLVTFGIQNPGMAVDTDSIMQSADIRADYDRRSVMGTTIPRNQHYLHDKFRMTGPAK